MEMKKNPVRWEHLTREEIRAFSQQGAIVLVPLGSIEQHGPHLPVGTDAMLAAYTCEKIAEELNRRGKPCLVSPAITVANSTHHMSFPGSMTLKPQTYLAMLQDYCESLAAHGFRKIVLMNGHGGNVAPTQTALININEALGFPVYFSGYYLGDRQAEPDILETQTHMDHACESETSMVLALDESFVDPIYKETKGSMSFGHKIEDDGIFSTFHRMEAHTENGVMGNSYAATAEKGKKILDREIQGMADFLMDDTLWGRKV